MWDSLALWIIVLQGFLVAYFEYHVWRMNKHRFDERASWREQKRKQAAKKLDTATSSPTTVTNE